MWSTKRCGEKQKRRSAQRLLFSFILHSQSQSQHVTTSHDVPPQHALQCSRCANSANARAHAVLTAMSPPPATPSTTAAAAPAPSTASLQASPCAARAAKAAAAAARHAGGRVAASMPTSRAGASAWRRQGLLVFGCWWGASVASSCAAAVCTAGTSTALPTAAMRAMSGVASSSCGGWLIQVLGWESEEPLV